MVSTPRDGRSLADLAATIGAENLPDVTINGITADSRDVRPGFLFVALPGMTTDGHAYAEEAVRRGAVAVLAEDDLPGLDVPVLRVRNSRRALAKLAAEWFDHPADELALVGITGSLGKTSVLTMLEAILSESGRAAGAVGSEIVGIRLGGHFELPTEHTTPDPLTLHQGFRALVDEGATMAAMEVSSHAIDQERVHGVQFSAGVFTNLVALEHKDYHGSFSKYVRVKRRFVNHVLPDAPLIYGIDSEHLRQELAGFERTMIGVGFSDEADILVSDLRVSTSGTAYSLRFRSPLKRRDGNVLAEEQLAFQLKLLGRPHVLNSAFAAAAALYLGVDPQVVVGALGKIEPPGRRMELGSVGGAYLLDDTAGHPDSVVAVFEVVRQLAFPRVHVVAAVRGHRGVDINARLSRALAEACVEQPFTTLIITDSDDAVDDLDRVSRDEREAFLGSLASAGIDFEHHASLSTAVDQLAERVRNGDLVVLIGAQGMRDGAGLLQTCLATDDVERVRGPS